jgi:hypothetical protein
LHGVVTGVPSSDPPPEMISSTVLSAATNADGAFTHKDGSPYSK